MSTDKTGPSKPRANSGGAAAAAGIVFQQHVGALVSTWMLSGAPLDRIYELGNARPIWLRFETEAPVDDILVATSDGGYLAFQVKTTLSSSSEPSTTYAKTVDQLVRHWLACRDGDGSMEWNRPLDPSKDRLVIAVGTKASEKVRVDLPNALRSLSTGGGGPKNSGQRAALDDFEVCVRRSWSNARTEQLPERLLGELSELISVVTVDPSEKEVVSNLAAFTNRTNALNLSAILEVYCGEEMSKRGGFDNSLLRRALITRGADLPSAPEFRSDIAKLRAHSSAVRTQLERYERIKSGDGKLVAIRRDCQARVEAAAESGSLLIIGEPGAGKSGVLNALARSLANKGGDVIELAVDQFSVETLEGIASELGLSHALLDVIAAWDGAEPGWLVVDALDATRGGKGEGAFRTLIERVVALDGRWRVVASIRTFDLRMGRTFREIFKGAPPSADLSEPEFRGVRHLRVPPWSENELEDLLEQAPPIKALLAHASTRLRELAVVPFNTRLIGELLEDGIFSAELSEVQTQAQLLGVYWDHRISRHGYEAEACLKRVVGQMMEARALRASRLDLIDAHPQALQLLVQEGVLIETESERWIQFRHHLLFDYVTSRVYLRPLLSSHDNAAKGLQGLGLMLAPAVSFCLQELWSTEANRQEFWNVVTRLVADEETDPVIRSVASWMPTELAASKQDVATIGKMLALGEANSEKAVQHFVGALAVRLDDKEIVSVDPWISISLAISSRLPNLARVARLLCDLLISRTDSPEGRSDLGEVSRKLLGFSLSPRSDEYLIESSIGFVIDTYDTNPEESRDLILKLFSPANFGATGWSSVPAVARKIETLTKSDPELARFVYEQTYKRDVERDHATNIGNSQILPLRSSARQDYELARYGLAQFFPKFLRAQPDVAASALSSALEGFVAREHATSTELVPHEMVVNGQLVRLQEDYSHIWAHDPEGKHAQDADSLVAKLLPYLREASQEDAMLVINELLSVSSLALLWARMFMIAAERKDAVAHLLWPFATEEAFILASETRKDAVDLISSIYRERSTTERIEFEHRALSIRFSKFSDSTAARATILARLFGAIGKENLLTQEAREALGAKATGPEQESNARLFSTMATWAKPSPYHWLEDLEQASPANAALITAIEAFKSAFGLDRGSTATDGLTLSEGVRQIHVLRELVDSSADAHQGLKQHATGTVGEAIAKLAERASKTSDEEAASQALLDLIVWIAGSPYPESDEDTEKQFAESAAWGSPAPRVDAAVAIFDLIEGYPALYQRLRAHIEILLGDRHPAVRLQAIGRLTNLWSIDRDAMWSLLRDRVDRERNPTVIRQGVCDVLTRVLNADVALTEELALRLLARYQDESNSDAKVRESVATVLTHAWVGYGRLEAQQVIRGWIQRPEENRKELRTAITDLRQIYVYGLDGQGEENALEIRHRAQALLHEIVGHLHSLVIEALASPEPSELHETVGRYIRIIDCACMQLYFAAESLGEDGASSVSLDTLLDEIQETLSLIGEVGTPHTIYYLLQLLEKFIPFDAGRVFDLIAASLLAGGRRFGYQYEPMGADLLVRLIGVYLADYKEVFEDERRRLALVQCLEVFMEAGWPSARRLLYRLPELVQ